MHDDAPVLPVWGDEDGNGGGALGTRHPDCGAVHNVRESAAEIIQDCIDEARKIANWVPPAVTTTITPDEFNAALAAYRARRKE